MDNAEFQQHTQRLEQLIERVNAIADEGARTTALQLMQALMDLHGSAVTRIVEMLVECGEQGRNALEKLGSDPLVCGLLVLYGVHPIPLQKRVSKAIERVTPSLRKQGGTVELLGISENVVKVAIQSSGNGCHSSPDVLRLMVEQALREAAPEVIEVAIEVPVTSQSAFVPLTMIKPAVSEEKKYEESAA